VAFNPEEVSAGHLQDYRSYLQTNKNEKTGEVMKPATINKRISAHKVYWSFLVDKGIVQIDVSRKVKVKRVSRLTETPR
jgi:integrase/recombinase XerC